MMDRARRITDAANDDTEAYALSIDQRESLLAEIDATGYAILPNKMPEALRLEAIAAILEIVRERRRERPELTSLKVPNCVDDGLAFRKLLMYPAALQLAHDLLGPMFHLIQSNFFYRERNPRDTQDWFAGTPWHADAPRPNLFPQINGVAGLHYLKFSFFLTDLTAGNGGSLQIVKGSHKRPELDNRGDEFRIEDYQSDVVQFDCEPGTVVAFHQGLWHAADVNRSEQPRINAYYSYGPTWLRPLDREFPAMQAIAALTAEERWLLGEPRPALNWWWPSEDGLHRMDRYKR
jgi:ectoine hydroxylase-related dioxygenase (phytanoyl-CoA dioxygenase family)